MNLSFQIFGRQFQFGRQVTTAPSAATNTTRTIPTRTHGRMYRAAQTDRLTQDWTVSISSADAEALTSNVALRSRHRQLERDNPIFRRTLRIFQNNVIGSHGISLSPRYRIKGTDAMDKDLCRMVKKAWKEALKPKNCTVRRNMSGVQLQRLGIRCIKRDGGILYRIHKNFANEFKFALELIEIDRLDHNYNRPAVGTDNQIKFGIERDQFGAPVAYHILMRHPGDVFAYSPNPAYRECIPADEILAVWDIDRAEQSIGVSDMCAVGTALHHLEEYILSENIAARLGADLGGWFEKEPGKAQEGGYTGPEDAVGNKIADREAGQWEELPDGWKAHQNDPKHPNNGFGEFIKANIRNAAIGAGISYESASGDLSNVNYSSWKAGHFEEQEEFAFWQHLIIELLMEPWFAAWVPYAIMSGKLDVPIYEKEKIIEGAKWQPRVWQSVEPLKDITADVAEINAGLSSRRRKAEERGEEVEEIDHENHEDSESASSYGLNYETDRATDKLAMQKETKHENAPANDLTEEPPKINGKTPVTNE